MLRKKFNEYMPNKYTSMKDLQDRLSGTICRFNGTPVFVQVKSESILQLWDVPTQGTLIKEISPQDPRLDISMLDLGYFNYQGHGRKTMKKVVYLSRSPSKKYKQGTCHSYIQVHDIDGKRSQTVSSSCCLSQGFVDAIEGRFPTITELEEEGELALSPDVAVSRDEMGILTVYFRGQKVAVKVPDIDKLHTVRNEHSWVIERFIGGQL